MDTRTMFWPDDDPVHPPPPAPAVTGGGAPVTSVLRPCVVLTENEPVTVAWNRMREHGEIGLVVDEDSRVVGLLGLREVSARWPTRPPHSGGPTVKEALRGVRTCRITGTTSIRDAVRQLLVDRRGAAAVVSPDGRALGLVTALDLLAALGGAHR